MTLRSQLEIELRRRHDGSVLDLPPNRIVEAVCAVLHQPAAGITMFHRLLRLPVAAFGERMAEAERLQVTLGDGPCLASVEAGEPMAFSEADIAERFPVYLDSLRRETPYRSVISLPLTRSDGRTFAALDMYGRDSSPHLVATLAEIQHEVGDLVAMLVLGASSQTDGQLDWPVSVEFRRRQQVWIAVGMVLELAHVDDVDALAILRAHAFREGVHLDDVADQLLSGDLTPQQVLTSA